MREGPGAGSRVSVRPEGLPRRPVLTLCCGSSWAVCLLLRAAASGPGPRRPPRLVWPRTGSGQCLPDGDDFWGMAVRTPRQVVGRRWTLGQSHRAVAPSRGFVRVPPGRVDVCVGDPALRHVHLPHLPPSGCAWVSAPPGGPHGRLLLRNQNTAPRGRVSRQVSEAAKYRCQGGGWEASDPPGAGQPPGRVSAPPTSHPELSPPGQTGRDPDPAAGIFACPAGPWEVLA